MATRGGANGIREADVREMLALVADLGALEAPEDFRTEALPGLRSLVPCEQIAYNEIRLETSEMFVADEPTGIMTDEGRANFLRYGQQNPLFAYYLRTRDGRPYKWSDFVTRRELHRTDIYRTVYAELGAEYQIAFALPAPSELTIAYALNRGSRDFSERDRRVLNLVRPPLIQAYRTVERYALLAARLATLERGMDESETGVAVLETGAPARIAFASSGAARCLGIESGGGEVPAALRDWLRAARDQGRRATAPALVEDPHGTEFVVHFMPARKPGDPDTLLTQRRRGMLSFESIQAAGLTRREAEVLQLVALGRSNAEVAAQLVVSTRTVQKHLQNIYDKLGATSRTQAALTAWAIDRTTEGGGT